MNLAILSIISLLTILYSSQVFSEGRSYQYAIITKLANKDAQKKTSITIDTTPPYTHTAYHGSVNSKGEILLRTWTCPGVTGRNRTCRPKKIFKN